MQEQKRRRKRRRLIMLIVLVLLIAGGAAGYFLVVKKPKAPEQTQSQTPAATETPVSTEPEELSEHYVSQTLQLAVDYPKTWQKDETGTSQLKLESPITKLDGTDTKIVVTVMAKTANPPGFTGTSGLAAAVSQKIAYTTPSQNQRKETYLSFVSFAGGNVSALYITGDSGYQKDQTIPKTDVAKGDPMVAVTLLKCEGTTCTEPASVSPELAQTNSTIQTAISILKSLVIQ